MKVDISKIALVVVMIAGIQTSVLYHRVNDLECQRDIYKSRYEDWENVSKEIAEYIGIEIVPTFVVYRDGKICGYTTGVLPEETLEERIREMLRK